MRSLGVLYDNGHGVAQDYARAREVVREGRRQGRNATATQYLGVLYENGNGVPQDYARAREWYEKAADKGDTTAMTNLGVLYDNGHGVAQDYVKAREWYEKAADKGEAIAHARPRRALRQRPRRAAGLRQGARVVREGRPARRTP